MKKVAVIFASIVVVVALVVGAWFLYWTVARESTQRRAEIRQDTFGRQQALVEQVLNGIREAERPGVPANQRIAIVDQVCDAAALLNNSILLPPNAAAFTAKECT